MFRLGDYVRITALLKNNFYVQDSRNRRRPKIGDIAQITKIYDTHSLGLRLTCKDFRGDMIWQLNFPEDAIELQVYENNEHRP